MTTAARTMRWYSVLVALIAGLSSVVFVPSALAQAKDTRFGSLFTPARTPGPETTPEDYGLGLLQTAAISGHVSHMHDWMFSDEGLDYLDRLVPWFRSLGLKVFLQIAPTVLGEPQPPYGLPRSFSSPQVRARYLSDVAHLARFEPEYLNLCAEVDLMAFLKPEELASFASLYREAYALVKLISPRTQVGVSYHMDLFFGFEEYWLPEFLGPQDYVAFTTYPSWVLHDGHVSSVDDFPTTFYDRVRVVFPTQPIIFSEVGWPSAGHGSVEEQAAFVRALPRLMAQANPTLVTWSTLSDTQYFQLALLTPEQRQALEAFVDPQSLFDQLNSMGLVGWDGTPKPAFAAAQELVFAEP